MRLQFKYVNFLALIILCCAALLAGCDSSREKNEQQELLLQGKTMGTTFNIKVFVPQQQLAELSLYSEVTDLLADVNQSMSTYIENSEINQFNRLPAGEVMPISDDFRNVVAESIRLGKSTKTLDVTMGPLIDLWGFGPDKRPLNRPTQSQLEQMISRIGVDKLQLTDQGLAKSVDDLELSFSATAKGYGIDKVAELLESHQLTNYMIEIGGEMRVSGQKPDATPWRIAIEKPDAPAGERQIHKVIEPGTMGVATSGNYRIFYEMEGQTYTHLIDPKTGMPILQDLVSVTVLHPSAMTADGLATALTVMGTQRAKAYAQEHKLAVYLMTKTEQGITTWSSEQFKPYL